MTMINALYLSYIQLESTFLLYSDRIYIFFEVTLAELAHNLCWSTSRGLIDVLEKNFLVLEKNFLSGEISLKLTEQIE